MLGAPMLFQRVWCGVVWCGVVWCGVVWCGVVWCGVVWCGVVWCGVVWCGVVWAGGWVHERVGGWWGLSARVPLEQTSGLGSRQGQPNQQAHLTHL